MAALNPDQFQGPQEEPHIQQAREFLKHGQPQEAVQVIRRHLSYAPALAQDYLLMGIALAEMGEGLQAVGAMEQAAEMDPHDATIAYNLGLMYRKAGRGADAVRVFEHALALRPDYDAARKALEQAGRQAQAVTQGMPAGAPQGPTKCPHCGMESRPGPSCEWCSHSLIPPPPVVDPAAAGYPGAPPGPPPVSHLEVPMSELDELAQGSLMQRLLKSAWKLISDPYTALDGGLDTFFNSPGAVWGVIAAYILSLIPQVILFLALPQEAGPGTGVVKASAAIVMVITSFAVVILSSGVIAVYNAITGGADNFLSDFGSLALSFAFIAATVQLSMLPLTLPLEVIYHGQPLSPAFIVFLCQMLWGLFLRVMLVVAATELTGCSAFILLLFANAVGYVAVATGIGALMVLFGG